MIKQTYVACVAVVALLSTATAQGQIQTSRIASRGQQIRQVSNMPVDMPEIKFVGVGITQTSQHPLGFQSVMQLTSQLPIPSGQAVQSQFRLPASLSGPAMRMVLCKGSEDFCVAKSDGAAIQVQVADVPVDGLYNFSIHIDAAKLVNTGLLDSEAISAIESMMSPDEVDQANLNGLARAARTRLSFALLDAFPNQVFDYVTTVHMEAGSPPTLDIQVDPALNRTNDVLGIGDALKDLLKKAKDLANCLSTKMSTFLSTSSDQLNYTITIHLGVSPSIDITISGTASGEEFSAFVNSLSGCFS